jgi:hypothetical protein
MLRPEECRTSRGYSASDFRNARLPEGPATLASRSPERYGRRCLGPSEASAHELSRSLKPYLKKGLEAWELSDARLLVRPRSQGCAGSVDLAQRPMEAMR